ncbi:LCP family protein [Planctomonas psychrotolerans]|uniref:LCP family protein n=1 Tax=Planctomonas psychrotolerans TaxID=2528712 RepID=UPI001238A50B|nr:LCP family protein [Planctomonas psychrotolerans]
MSDAPSRAPRRDRVSSIARHGRLKRSNPLLSLIKGISIVLAVVLVSGGSVAAIALWDLDRTIQRNSVDISGNGDGELPEIGEFEGGVNLLLVGSDSGEGDPQYGVREDELNDVTMLMHIAEDHSNAVVVSFPRDLIVPIPECTGEDGTVFPADDAEAINQTLSRGGLACVVETVEALTDLDVPYAAEIQFNGVIEMSNAIGGVPVCVAEPIRDSYTGLSLAAGEHELQGMDALQFLRTRHGVGDGSDLGRISNQQVFLSSLVRTVKSSETLSDPAKLYGLARAAVNNMNLSTSLANYDTLVSIALTLRDIPLESVAFVQYPGTTAGTGIYAGRVQPLQEAADEMFALIKADERFALSPEAESIGSVADPDATPVAPAPDATAAPVDAAPDAPAAPTATATPGAPATPEVPVLPPSVTGQTAADYTCSDGRKD